MIRAGALLYAMFLVMVIAIISSSFVMVNYYNNTYILNILKQEQLYQDVNSGINYGLALHQEIPIDGKIEVDLYGDETHKVTLTKKNWGAFYVITAASSWKNRTAEKAVMVGNNIQGKDEIALYLADQNKPLSLTGKTSIVGNCYLPKAGVKRAYIEGKSFSGNRFINGIKKQSEKTLPEVNEELIDINVNNFSNFPGLNDSVVAYESVVDLDSIVNSFQNKSLVLYSFRSIVIENQVIDGNVIIKSDRNITIKSDAKISSAVVYAKGIVVEDDFEGDLQLFATDSIQVQENCQLNYPSVLALLIQDENPFQHKIEVMENTVLKGAVFLVNKKTNRKHPDFVSIGPKTKISGQLYSSEQLELRGEVKGGVFCKKLLLKTPSSVYENHLMDATIDREALSANYVGVPITEAMGQQKVIKWLN